MERTAVEKVLSANIKKIYAYAVNHVANEHDREDLAQEICLLAFKSMCTKEIQKPEHYLWVVAHHCLANYYRKNAARHKTDTSADCETLCGADLTEATTLETADELAQKETAEVLKNRIAYLSKMRRQIIIQYYYEEQKQTQIAKNLNIPVGTVKWHLNIAKQELKKGIEKMEHTKNIKNCKFDPIRFDGIKLYGSVGTTGSAENIIRAGLCQNILYVIYREAKTVNELADILSVSPVFIESEIEFLEKHSVVIKNGSKYQTNILIEERTTERMKREEAYYRTVAKKIAAPIFDAIRESEVLGAEIASLNGTCGSTGGACGNTGDAVGNLYSVYNENYMMYTLFLYFFTSVVSNYVSNDGEITFDDVADIRSDGGKNLFSAVLANSIVAAHEKAHVGEVLHGPAWNEREYSRLKCKLWIINDFVLQPERSEVIWYVQDNVMDSLCRFIEGKELSVEEKTYLIEHRMAKKAGGDIDLRIPILYENEAVTKLENQIAKIRDDVFAALKPETDAYKKAVLKETPPHLKKQQGYLLQELTALPFYVRQELFYCGKLKPLSTEELETAGELFVVKRK